MKVLMRPLWVLIMVMFCFVGFSQVPKQEKRIYLLDVTASMEGKDDEGAINIFEEVKEKLSNAVLNLKNESSEIVVIPFTSETFTPLRYDYYNKEEMGKQIKNLKIRKGETNIDNAFKKGIEELDSTKINFLFLLTDGIHNYGVPKEKLFETLASWQEIAKDKYFFAFYVMLTPNAKELEITQIADKTPQMWSVETLDVNISLITLPIKATVNTEGKDKTFRFSFPPINDLQIKDSGFSANIDDNSFYEIYKTSFKPEDGYITFQLKEKRPHTEMPLSTNIKLNFSHNKDVNPLLFFAPESVLLTVQNRGSRIMTIKQK